MRAFAIRLVAAGLSIAALSCEGKPQPQQPVTAPGASDAPPTAAAPAPAGAGTEAAPGPTVAPAPAPRTGPTTTEMAPPPPAPLARAGGERDHVNRDRDGGDDADDDDDDDDDDHHDRDEHRDRDGHERDSDHDRHRDADHRATPTAPPASTTAPGGSAAHARVGPDKCKMCHRVEHQSWSSSAHAAKGLDCESCHGNGGDYWTAAVMRDHARAAAAGLVMPGVATCRRCHANATPALLPRAHAHGAH